MTDSRSVSKLLNALQVGDDEAANALWEQYFRQLTQFARAKLGQVMTREADEDDIVLSAMQSFLRGAAEGRFPKLDNRDDLWKLLVVITARKISTLRKRQFAQKRGGGEIRGESVFGKSSDEPNAGIGNVVGAEPTPDFSVEVAETCRHMLDDLGEPTLRQVAILKLEGYNNGEIAEQLGLTRRSIERKLQRIRDKWSRETVQ